MLTEDEQVYHRYLVAKPAVVITEKDVEKSYIDDCITLQEYKDYKFPDRKRIRELHAMHWSLSLTNSLTHSLTHSLTNSLTH